MQSSDSKRLTREALLALFAGLSLSACSKSESTAAAEKPSQATAPSAAPAVPSVSATELAKPAGSAEKDGSCAPGGCSPGACGGSKKE